jgi:DNA primase
VIKKGLNVKIISLPGEEDPDSFLIKNPPEALQHLIDNAFTLTEFLKLNKNLVDTREAIDNLLEISRDITDPVQQDLFIKDISESFNVQESSLRQKAARRPHYEKQDSAPVKKEIKRKRHIEEEKLLQCVLKNKELLKKVASALDCDYFINEDSKKIFKFLTENQDLNYIDNSAVMLNQFEDEELRNEISTLLFAEEYQFDIDDLIKQIKLRKYQEDIKRINEEISNNPDEAELFERKLFLKKEIQALSNTVVHKTLF